MVALNLHLSKIVSEENKVMKVESKAREHEVTSTGDLVFKALHLLIYEWYAVHLEYLHPTLEFEQDQRRRFVEENRERFKAARDLENDLDVEDSDIYKAFEQWKLPSWLV